jgi:hypothetical protein
VPLYQPGHHEPGVAAWYLEHRYRTGADVSAAVPYLLGGVSFQSDFVLAP